MNSRKLALALFATWLGCAIGAVIAHFFITPDVSLNQMTFVTAALGAAFYTVKLGYGSAPAEKRPATESSPFRSEPDAMLMAEVERLKEENAKAAKENDKLRLSTPYFAVSVGAIVTMILFGLVLASRSRPSSKSVTPLASSAMQPAMSARAGEAATATRTARCTQPATVARSPSPTGRCAASAACGSRSTARATRR